QPSSIHSLCSAPAPPHPTLIPQSPPHLLHLHPSPTRRSSDLVAGHEQGGLPLAHPRGRNRLQGRERAAGGAYGGAPNGGRQLERSEEHTSELQSLRHLVCRLLLEKKIQYFNCYLAQLFVLPLE